MVTLKECTKCALSKSCKSVGISPTNNPRVDVLVVADNPSYLDDKNGSILENDKDDLLFRILTDVIGADMDNVHFTYAVRCHKGSSNISKKEIDACREYLVDEIAEVQPKVILTLGEVAMNVVTGVKGITKNRGLNLKSLESKIDVIPTFSSAYIDRMPEHLNKFGSDIHKAFALAKGEVVSKSTTATVFVDTIEKVKELIGYCQQTRLAVFDFENTEIVDGGVFAEGFRATMLSISFQIGSGWEIPLYHHETCFNNAEIEEIFLLLKEGIFENDLIRKVAHNLYWDASVLHFYGIKLLGKLDDTLLMHHLIDETKKHGLKELVSFYFPAFDGYDAEVSQYKWDAIPMAILSKYAATDTDMCCRLLVQLESELMQDMPSYIIYRNLTMSAFTALWGGSMNGMDIDRHSLRNEFIPESKKLVRRQTARLKANPIVKRYEDYVSNQARESAITELEEKLAAYVLKHPKPTATEAKIRDKLRDIKTGVVNVYSGILFSSVPQLTKLLFDHPEGFNFRTIEKGTGKDILDTLNDKSGFVDNLIMWRSLKKNLSTYLEGIDKKLDSENKIHSTFKLQGTASGRLSSADPNLQNLPNSYKIKDEELLKIVAYVKRSFIVREGETLVQLDYAQAELRVIAACAKEDTMMEVYRNNGDIHTVTGSEMMEVTLEKFKELDKAIQKDARQKAKAVNFGLIYGMGAAGFREYARTNYGLILTMEESTKIRDMFFQKYPKLLVYHEEYIAKGRKFGWVRTLFGRRRRLPDINSSDDYKASMDERVAINSPIQGTAGEFTIFAIALLQHRINPRVKFRNTIHDSILYTIPNDILQETLLEMKYTCENLPTMQYFGKELYGGIGMAVDIEGTTTNWGEMSEIKLE